MEQVQLVGSIQRNKSAMYNGGSHGAASYKTGPKMVWRWVLVCMALGSAAAVAICGLLAGYGDFVIRQQHPALFQAAPFVVPDEQFVSSSSSIAQHRQQQHCQGKRLYIYNLPRLFNLDILDRYCQNKTDYPEMCAKFVNSGMGFKLEHVMEPLEAWYRTDQFSLDLLFHDRLKKYPCLTQDPETADLFYAPYYAGLDVTEFLFATEIQLRDKLTQRFLGWMMAQPSFVRLQGHKHLLLLGRIVWDFHRTEVLSNWGNSLLKNGDVENMTALILERDPEASEAHQMAVPYPTSFHPKTDAELKLWQEKVASSNRDLSLVSFAGSPRRNKSKGHVMYAYLRDNLFEQCDKSNLCTPLLCDEIDCQANPHLVTNLLLRSTFCLQPPGDSPTRKGVFDCLVAGTIPVFFTVHSAYNQYLWHLPKDGDSYSVLYDEDEVRDKGFDVMAALQQIPASKIKSMQETILHKIIPVILYDHIDRDPNKKTKDAIDVILDHLLVEGFQTYPDEAKLSASLT
ncbi:xyloglucan galactosyltransferase MUR3 [Marchantia polymorpha subsp. ruderalis]|uniref:Exostosin GT47 domain-containing protein n=2 Tax=Marchantia polymorpha TaxID=3197 RepID=A0AAF6BVT5_MARPO|nr:hypothetical protein MARPO_0074s0038 [Marchantia polymorpha]BBN16119.1 hypothetical protein Mp_7g03580 [Marchantia polymorpha subsp. ruderalis]|eukprot:PTQ35046.1 hypothetical protein MARPO_0074s0038 [Marchantia polymorpha]